MTVVDVYNRQLEIGDTVVVGWMGAPPHFKITDIAPPAQTDPRLPKPDPRAVVVTIQCKVNVPVVSGEPARMFTLAISKEDNEMREQMLTARTQKTPFTDKPV